jgi:hypothetical protein
MKLVWKKQFPEFVATRWVGHFRAAQGGSTAIYPHGDKVLQPYPPGNAFAPPIVADFETKRPGRHPCFQGAGQNQQNAVAFPEVGARNIRPLGFDVPNAFQLFFSIRRPEKVAKIWSGHLHSFALPRHPK